MFAGGSLSILFCIPCSASMKTLWTALSKISVSFIPTSTDLSKSLLLCILSLGPMLRFCTRPTHGPKCNCLYIKGLDICFGTSQTFCKSSHRHNSRNTPSCFKSQHTFNKNTSVKQSCLRFCPRKVIRSNYRPWTFKTGSNFEVCRIFGLAVGRNFIFSWFWFGFCPILTLKFGFCCGVQSRSWQR